MKGLVALAACALAQDAPIFSFSSNFNASSAKTYPISSYDTTCSLSGTEYPYVVVNYSFPTAGVRLITTYGANFIQVTNSSNGYNISNLCEGNQTWPLTRTNTFGIGSYTYQYGHWFEAGSYTFIVQGNEDSVIAEIWDGKYHGQLSTNTNQTWAPLKTVSKMCSQGSSQRLFDTQIVSVNTSGYYNAYVALNQNRALGSFEQIPDGAFLSVLKGNVNVSAAVCDTNFAGGSEGDNLNVGVMDLWLDANQNYTFVVSGDVFANDQYLGYYTLVVTPGGYRQFTAPIITANGFSRPTIASCDRHVDPIGTCSNNDDPQIPIPYSVAYFSVPRNSPFYVRVSPDGGSEEDLAYFLYSEKNSGTFSPLTCGSLRQTCFYGTDSFSSGELFQSGDNDVFTLVVTGYFNDASRTPSGTANSSFVVITGPVVGASQGSRAPTAAPSGAPSTAAPSTVAPSGAPSAPTTKAPGSTEAPTSRRPTNVGETYAPTGPVVSGVAHLFPALALYAGALLI